MCQDEASGTLVGIAISIIDVFYAQLPRCEKVTKEACYDHFDAIDCRAAFDFCHNELTTPYLEMGTHFTPISHDAPIDPGLRLQLL